MVEIQAIREATEAIGEATQPTSRKTTTPLKDKTLFDIFNEAMEEPPRDIGEDFSRYGRTVLRDRKSTRLNSSHAQ